MSEGNFEGEKDRVMTIRNRKQLNVFLELYKNFFNKISIDLKQSLVRQKIAAQQDQKGKQSIVWANLAAWKGA